MAVSMQTHDLDIRPISDLRNKFSEVADLVQDGQPIIFTKNGYGYMVTMSYNAFKSIQDPVLAELKRTRSWRVTIAITPGKNRWSF